MEVDVSDWEPADEEPLGTKPKQWLRDTAGVRWLWKESTLQHDLRHGEFRKGDDWAEVVAGEVGVALGIPVAEVHLATRGDLLGIISRNVIADDSEALVHGNELLSELGVVTGDPRDRTGYTIDAVTEVLDGVGPPLSRPSASASALPGAFDWFAGYLVLDAVIGNSDRHQDNWGVLRAPTYQRLSPSFDHASCLGFLLSDEERLDRVASGRAGQGVQAYARATRTKFENRQHPIDAAISAVSRLEVAAADHWRTVLGRLPSLDGVISGLPWNRMSEPARRFAAALYRENHDSLSHRLRTMER